VRIKYVIFDGFYPAIISGQTQHCDVHIEGHKLATSAGFFSVEYSELLKKYKVTTFEYSHSLNLSPTPTDSILLELMFNL
jgi:hypothetical protein